MKGLLRATASLLLIAVTLVTASCHGKRMLPEFEMPQEFDESREYNITFWAKNDTNMKQKAIYADAIAGFQEKYPNITVNIQSYTDYGTIYNDVITNISTGTTPNVCITYPDHIATYLTGTNVVAPLDMLINDSHYGLGGSEVKFDSVSADSVIPAFLTECTVGDGCYALPFMRSTEACYVNKTYVEALGYTLPETLTWDFVWEVSDAATAKDAEGVYTVNGQKTMIPFIYKSTDNMMIQLLRQKNAGYSTAEGDILIFNDTTRELLFNIADHVRLGSFATFKIVSYPGNFFNAGQCLFAIDSTAGSTWIGSDAPLSDIHTESIVDFETVVMTVPQFDTENPRMISQGPSVCVFNKDDPQEVLASWLFAQYLLTDGVQTAYAQTEGYVPVTVSAQSSDGYLDYLSRAGEDNNLYYSVKIAASRMLLDNLDNTFITPVFNGSVSLRDAAGQMIENVTKSIRRSQTVDEAYMDKLYTDVTALYRLGQARDSSAPAPDKPGPLPVTAIILLGALVAVWAVLGVSAVITAIRKKRNRT